MVEIYNIYSYLLYEIIEKAKKFIDINDPNFKREILEKLCKYSANSEYLNKANVLLNEIFKGYTLYGCYTALIEMQLKSRAITGINQDFAYVPFEVGINFDMLLSIPYIPGSSIKGAVKAAWGVIKRRNLGDREFYEADEQKLFGAEKQAGSIIFSDAFPVKPGRKGFILYPDVITPHYSVGGEDILNELDAHPNPIPHLSIAPETIFSFVIAIPKRISGLDMGEAKKIFKNVLKALNVALKLGIGARTNVGYGRFELKRLKICSPR